MIEFKVVSILRYSKYCLTRLVILLFLLYGRASQLSTSVSLASLEFDILPWHGILVTCRCANKIVNVITDKQPDGSVTAKCWMNFHAILIGQSTIKFRWIKAVICYCLLIWCKVAWIADSVSIASADWWTWQTPWENALFSFSRIM